MRIKQYNTIIRSQYPKWCGWKILDFYNTINSPVIEYQLAVLSILEENLNLVKQLESKI